MRGEKRNARREGRISKSFKRVGERGGVKRWGKKLILKRELKLQAKGGENGTSRRSAQYELKSKGRDA